MQYTKEGVKMEENNKLYIAATIIMGAIAFIMGLVVYQEKAEYFEYRTILGGQGAGIYAGKFPALEEFGDKAAVGVIIMLCSVLFIVVALLIIGHRERSKKQLQLLQTISNNSSASSADDGDITSKLKKLTELRTQDLITQEEYEQKRRDLINRL